MGEAIDEVMDMIPHLISMPYRKKWVDYDEEADILYINFTYSSEAVEHEEDEEAIIRNYNERGDLAEITIIAASRFTKRNNRA
jgi:uncharacterized protein YuzE